MAPSVPLNHYLCPETHKSNRGLSLFHAPVFVIVTACLCALLIYQSKRCRSTETTGEIIKGNRLLFQKGLVTAVRRHRRD
ncbi:hypothetical protein JTE90_006518 [Oedothorax gibbosus]|uniref:Uncharacterized protein n=1 Tax=Oedothorax gibbosus TaxID=931172 RepID=A0AAV6THR9_9ARAC|nr:hypothetical protein JTE90_006518 [Oedothorax gibbosus]